LTVSELAREAGLTLQTTSAHLVKLQNGNLVMAREQGRHCYFQLAPPGVAAVLEALMGLVAERGHVRTRIGPRDETPRVARRCYNHLAGAAGVQLDESLTQRDYLIVTNTGLSLSPHGRAFSESLGIDLSRLSARRPRSAGNASTVANARPILSATLAKPFSIC
jgi:hypothetical protein|tara:strand:- start:1568 stop:2059 length:492 start_codon:yes stop_codon:yes gene_type:complete